MCMRNRRPSDPRRTMSLADKEDATMKKKTLSILSLCIALFAAFAPVSYTHLTLPTILGLCRSRWSPYH